MKRRISCLPLSFHLLYLRPPSSVTLTHPPLSESLITTEVSAIAMVHRFLRLLGSFFFSCCEDSELLELRRRATQNTHHYYQLQNDDTSDRWQPNRSANQNRPHLHQFDDEIFKENLLTPRVQEPDSCVNFGAPARSYACPSKIESNDSKVVHGHTQINPSFDQSDVKLYIFTGSFPSKAVSSSSSQRPDAASFAQSNVKSNTTTSSLFTKTVPSSSPSRPDAISLPNNFIIKPANVPRMHYVPKKDTSEKYVASKPVPAVSPTPKPTSSPIYSLQQARTSPFVGSDFGSNSFKSSASSKACLDQTEFRDSKSNASPKSGRGLSDIEGPKKVGKGGTERGANVPRMHYVPKKDTSAKSVASEPVPAVSPTPKPTSSSIYSLKQARTLPFVQSNFDLNSFKSSASSKACLDQTEYKDSKSNVSPKSGRGPSDIEDPKKVGKGGTERYLIPEHREMIKNDIVPWVLKMSLSPDTYADYFAALLYAEDFVYEVIISWVWFN
jgi:hypothetical protein